MRTASSSFNTYNALNYKNVVFAMEFGDGSTIFVSDTFADYASAPEGVTYKKLLLNIRISTPELQLHEAHYNPTTYSIDLEDNNAQITSFLSSNRLFGALCVIKIGFKEINYADFLTLSLAGTKFFGMQLDSELHVYTLTARDTLFDIRSRTMQHPLLDSGIFNPSGLNATLNSGFTTRIEVVDSREYGVEADFENLLDEAVITAVRVGTELIRYETKDDGFDYLNTLTRALGGTTDQTHGTNENAYGAIGFLCDPMRAFLHIMMNTNGGANGNYDLGIDVITFPAEDLAQNFYPAISLSTDQVDFETIERLGWKHFHEYEYSEGYIFIVPATAENLAEFVEELFMKPFGFYLYIKNGKIAFGSLDVIDFIENFTAADTLDSSNIDSIEAIDFSNYEDARQEYQYFTSQYNWATREFANSDEVSFLMPGLSEDIFQVSQFQINAFGADLTALPQTAQQATLNKLRFYLLAEVSMLVKVRCKYETCLLEVGDRVYLTLSQLPNINAGARGVTEARALIVAQEFDLVNKAVIHTLRVFEIPGYFKNQVTSYYDINKVEEGDINDTALAVSVTEGTSTEAADAYYDNSGTAYAADIVMCRIRITQPNYGSGSTHEQISLKITLLETGPAIIVSDYRRYIKFNPQSAEEFEIDLYIANDGSTIDRVKIDWIATTATGSEVPTVEFIGVWFIVLNTI